jgi:hypothetical protein
MGLRPVFSAKMWTRTYPATLEVDSLIDDPFETNRELGERMVPLYAARILDLGPGDFVKIDCGACSHTALLAPAFLNRLGINPLHKVLDLQDRVRCRGCGARGRAIVSIRWGSQSTDTPRYWGSEDGPNLGLD